MSLQDLEKLERQLYNLQTKNSQLISENVGQRVEIDRLNQRVNELEILANNQPIHLIAQQLDPLALRNSLAQLQDKISSKTYEIAYLEQLVQDKSILLSQAQSKINDLEVQLEENNLQNELLSHQIKSAALRDEKNRKDIDLWRGRLEKANQDRLKIINEKDELSKKLKQEINKNQNALLDLGKEVAAIRESAGKSTIISVVKNELQEILTLQQQELQDRNYQISRLKAINGNYGQNSEVEHLKNTIKHLRGEISRYSSLIQHTTDKLALAETTIQRYSASAQKCDQELSLIGEMNQRLHEQTQIIKNLEDELSQKSQESEREKRLISEIKKTLVEVLQENQCFHEFLYETYGDNFELILNNEKQRYQERLSRRIQLQKWVNVEELVDVNERLRAKLQMG